MAGKPDATAIPIELVGTRATVVTSQMGETALLASGRRDGWTGRRLSMKPPRL